MELLQEGEQGEQGSMEGRARTVEERITTRYLTKYERARVLGTRALQIRSVGIPYTLLVTAAVTLQHACTAGVSLPQLATLDVQPRADIVSHADASS